MHDSKSTEAKQPYIAGIAHDFRNLLMSVLGQIELAERLLSPQDPASGHLAYAQKGAERAVELAEALLVYAKTGEVLLTGEKAEPARVIQEIAELTLADQEITLHLDLPATLPPLSLSALHFTQIIQNLILNAEQAMGGRGSLSIIGCQIPHKQGSALKLTINDTGPGITADVMSRIFEPGFTTKATGNGIGLSQVKNLVESAGGKIDIQSTLGKGTSITLVLPFQEIPASATRPPLLPPTQNRGRVLVLDDDDTIRSLAGEMLKCLGYTPDLVDKGEEAVRRYREARETGVPFESVILDLTLPGGMDGKTVFDRLKDYDPNLKAIVSTGHTHHPVVKHYKEHGFKGCVLKPYKLQDLGAVLQ